MKKIILVVFGFLLLVGCNTSDNSALSNDRVIELDKLTQEYSKAHDDMGVMLLENQDGTIYKSSYGLRDRENQSAMRTDEIFEIGSASKIFTAIAIFQLIEDKKISLNTTLDEIYPKGKIRNLANYKGKNYWNKITVGMLLNHTSGMIDYLNVYGDDKKAIEVFSNHNGAYTFNEMISLALKFGDANFKPGEKFKYSNTGYLILGDIVSKYSGVNWRDYIKTHILDVAGVKNTYFGTRISSKMRAKMPIGYYDSKRENIDLSLADSAGEMISTLDDLNILINAWIDGKYYKNKKTLDVQLTQGYHYMYSDIKNITYGYGLMKVGDYYGHGGQTFGFGSYLAINPKTHRIYVVGVNDAKVPGLNLFIQAAKINLQD